MIFTIRTTANREDQVLDFITSNVQKRNLNVYSVIRPHGLRGYIFIEAEDKQAAEEAHKQAFYRNNRRKECGKAKRCYHSDFGDAS